MAVGDLAALSVGAPVERVAVIVQPDGERGIGVRTCVHLALTYDDQLSRAGVATMLAAVRTRLERLGQERRRWVLVDPSLTLNTSPTPPWSTPATPGRRCGTA